MRGSAGRGIARSLFASCDPLAPDDAKIGRRAGGPGGVRAGGATVALAERVEDDASEGSEPRCAVRVAGQRLAHEALATTKKEDTAKL